MTDDVTVRRAAALCAAGLALLACFQLLLAAGAPMGVAAWGGAHEGRLPAGLRVGSGVSVLAYAAAVVVVLRCGGFAVRWVPRSVACVGTWVLAVLLVLGTLANLASGSPWERFLLAPVTVILAGLCVVVARAAGVQPPGARRPLEASR